MKDIKDMRHEVIEYAISLNNVLDHEIMTYFDLFAHDDYAVQVEGTRNIFFKSFLLNMAFPKKFRLIKEIIEEIGGSVSKEFGANTEKFTQIRNTFAHSLYPEKAEEFMPTMYKSIILLEQKEWERTHEEAKALYKKIITEIDRNLYEEQNRMKKYKTFSERWGLDLIRHYEKLLRDKEPKKKGKSKKK